MLLAFAVTFPIVLWDTSGDPIANGDEAIYAQVGREMYDSGAWEVPIWQGTPILPRPPLSFWVLAVGRALGAHEASVRLPLGALVAVECGLVVLLGARLFSLGVGVLAAALLLSTQLVLRYGRYYESEPLLCIGVLLAFLGYERMRRERSGVALFAVGLAAALLTKQIIGLLPLGAIVVDRLVRRDSSAPPVTLRRIAVGVGAALLLVLPWYARMLARFPEFLSVHFVANVIKRSKGQVLRETTWTYYGEQLLRERVLGVVFVLACLIGLVVAWRKQSRGALLVSGWGLAVLMLYSLARSRYDYYLLLAYPAFALATAALVLDWLPLRGSIKVLCGAGLVVANLLTTWPEVYGTKFGDLDFRALIREGEKRAPDTTEILIVEQVPYTARYYADMRRKVTMLLRSKNDYEGAIWHQEKAGMPTAPELAPDLPAALQRHGPSLLIVPSVLQPIFYNTPLQLLAKTPTYSLFRWR